MLFILRTVLYNRTTHEYPPFESQRPVAPACMTRFPWKGVVAVAAVSLLFYLPSLVPNVVRQLNHTLSRFVPEGADSEFFVFAQAGAAAASASATAATSDGPGTGDGGGGGGG